MVRDAEELLRFLRGIEGTQETPASYHLQAENPQVESLTAAEEAELLESGCTSEVVYDMIANAYSHLRKQNYEAARKQLGILKSVPSLALDGDEEAQRTARNAISDLEGRLN